MIDSPLKVDPKFHIAYIYLLAFNGIVGYRPCWYLRDLGLPDPFIHVILPPLNSDILPDDDLERLALLN